MDQETPNCLLSLCICLTLHVSLSLFNVNDRIQDSASERRLSERILYKFVLVGDSGVGKSSVLLRFTDDSFCESYINTIGVDFRSRTLHIDDQRVVLQIWDTAGQERFRTITSTYYRGAQGIILMYDVTNYQSWLNIPDWLHEVEKETAKSQYQNQIKLLLIGNKSDLSDRRKVSFDDALHYARTVNVEYIECSAKSSENIEAAFINLTKHLLSVKSLEQQYISPPRVEDIEQKHIEPESSCCTLI